MKTVPGPGMEMQDLNCYQCGRCESVCDSCFQGASHMGGGQKNESIIMSCSQCRAVLSSTPSFPC